MSDSFSDMPLAEPLMRAWRSIARTMMMRVKEVIEISAAGSSDSAAPGPGGGWAGRGG